MNIQVRNAIAKALRVIGSPANGYDVDAVYGSLITDGVHVMGADEVTAAMFDDRCDFECPICHPENEEATS